MNYNNNQFFEKIQGDESFYFLKDAQINRVIVNKKRKSWKIVLEGPFKVNEETIERLERNCLMHFNFLSNVSILWKEINLEKRYDTIQQWYNHERENLFLWIKTKFPAIAALIPFENWICNNNELVIQSTSEIIINSIKNKDLESIIKERISKDVITPFKIKIDLKKEHLNHTSFEDSKEEELKKIVEVAMSDVQVNTKTYEKNNKNKPNLSKVFKGQAITKHPMDIKDITLESGNAIIQGEIFDIDFRIFNNNKGIITFNITDYTNSITVKTFEKKEDIETLQGLLSENPYVKVKGDIQFDKYSKEIAMMARDIQQVTFHQRMDNYENKRVELHAHTQFSAMDGVTNIKKLVSTAAKWNHKAIAITDHGVLQGFPDAMAAAKKNNIKVIYGIEGYLANDDENILIGDKRGKWDQPFVVFDVETTGLSPENDQLTEIGAVKIKDGKIIDQFNTLINPGCLIPPKITELTGITNDMVQDSPSIDVILPKFLDFCGESILVAHNAKFDISFIKSKAKTMNQKVTNSIIDTLMFARLAIPSLKRHRLNNLAKYFGVKLENHHRAVDDAQATAEIFLKLVDMAKEQGANAVEDLNSIFKDTDAIKKVDTYHIIILVKNEVGLKNLYKLVSHSHLDYFYRKPRIPKSLLRQYKEGLLIGTACEAGELYKALLRNADESEIEDILTIYDYLEIQPLANNDFLINKEIVKDKNQLIEINKKVVSLGEKYSKPVVGTCDVHFLEERDEIYRRILMYGQGFNDADNQPPLYFRTTEEMLKEFNYLSKEKREEIVITNTNYIADQIEDILPIPEGTFPPKIDGSEEEIYNMTMNKAHEIYGEILPDIVKERVEKELNSIISNGYAVLYLISHKLVKKSLEDGYLVGSRGSVGSSLVATFTDITEVNPLPPHYICPNCKNSEFFDSNVVGVGPDLPDANCPKCNTLYKKEGFDIPFEVFLGFEGDKEPDIDLNFSGDYQPVAHRYTEELFGKGQVFRAGTIGTIAEKTAYGFVKNYVQDHEQVLHNAEINRLVKGCTGVKRTTGQHPGGIMVVPGDKEIYDFCPIQKPADDQDTDIITTHFDYHSISENLLKLDILGHDDPTVIKMLEELTGVDATTIPLDDKKTISLFTSTDALGVSSKEINSTVGTFGIPEFGTSFVRKMLVDTKPTAFADLLRISGLSHGTDVWLNNAQELVQNNICTIKEVISTRDDIMVYLIFKGLPPKTAFKIMESVRKGRGLTEEDEKIMKENNVPNWYIESCKKIKYMFPKAHAAAYVTMAFRIAYFKVHYPLAFYATYFTVRTDDFDADLIIKGPDSIRMLMKEIESKGNDLTAKEKGLLTVLEISLEMYCRGYKILPIDLYKSHAEKFLIKDNTLLPPLNSLQGLGTKAAYNIMKARESNKFISKEDMQQRCKIGKSVTEILERHGCLKNMPESNQLSLF